MADLENIHLTKGRTYPGKPPPQNWKTWEEVRKKKEERILKAKRERALSTPLETTSTEAMDTEEAQEVSKEIAEKAAKRELRKQMYVQYQKMKQMSDYKVPRADPIPVPNLNKPKQRKEGRLPSALSNFDVPQYEEISGYNNRWQLGIQSANAIPRLSDKKGQQGRDEPKIPSGNVSAFQDYMPTMMSALNNPWKPLSKGTATPSWMVVPPLVFLSTPRTPVSRPQTGEGLEEGQVKMNFSPVDKTVLVPKGRDGAESAASPIKFTKVVVALEENRGEPAPFVIDSKIQGTPTAESTRVPLKTSTKKREAREQKEPLTPDELLEMEQTDLYNRELAEAEEDMVQAYIEKSRLEMEEAEISLRAMEAQRVFEALEQKRDGNQKINDKMREEIRKMEQAVADSSSFIKNLG